MKLIIDSHLDLGWSAVSFNRDLRLEVEEVRRREAHMTDERARGHGTVTLPELRRGGVAVCFATLLARSGPERKTKQAGMRTDLDYADQTVAYAAAHGQLAYYRVLEQLGEVRMLKTRGDLDNHWSQWQDAGDETADLPVGLILSMEGADPILHPAQVEQWWDHGLRAVGPVHYGRSHYAYGTGVSGPLSDLGIELLKQFEQFGILLDVTHLCDESMAQALDLFGGQVLASHHNCRELVAGDRQLTDEQITRLVRRDAVIGAALDAWMLYPGWKRGETKPDVVSLEDVANHIDRVCQIAGDAKHAAIGSDLDGGFGYEQTPGDLNTIADLQKLDAILARRGYSEADVIGVFHGNWLNLLRRCLPQ